ncbi:MAG: ParB/RepB/Spo0J family partition protein [Nitriliruptor sp.]|nr:MAG: ParB/RepB/Spo0J family partition protein [Nitriliruptor sp.]
MTRRSGLGRGLAALIPPPTSRTEEEASPRQQGETAGDRALDTASIPAPERAADPQTAGLERSAPEREVEAPHAPEPDEPGVPESQTDPHLATAVGPATYAEVDPDLIAPNPRQPREVFDPDELEGLSVSLADVGMLQPLVVRPLADGRYELVAGERRLRAAYLAGLPTVPVLIRHTEDADLLKEALVENIHRVQLNPLEEAAAYQQLLEEFGVTQEELATRLGRSRPAVSNTIRLLQLPPSVQRRVAAGVLSAGHARALLAIPDGSRQSALAERIVTEGLSVRATEELVRVKLMDEPSPRSKPRRTPTAPGVLELQDDLSDALQARVRITMGAKKGRLAVEFGSVDDLERIVAVIADGLGAQGAPREGPDQPVD